MQCLCAVGLRLGNAAYPPLMDKNIIHLRSQRLLTILPGDEAYFEFDIEILIPRSHFVTVRPSELSPYYGKIVEDIYSIQSGFHSMGYFRVSPKYEVLTVREGEVLCQLEILKCGVSGCDHNHGNCC